MSSRGRGQLGEEGDVAPGLVLVLGGGVRRRRRRRSLNWLPVEVSRRTGVMWVSGRALKF